YARAYGLFARGVDGGRVDRLDGARLSDRDLTRRLRRERERRGDDPLGFLHRHEVARIDVLDPRVGEPLGVGLVHGAREIAALRPEDERGNRELLGRSPDVGSEARRVPRGLGFGRALELDLSVGAIRHRLGEIKIERARIPLAEHFLLAPALARRGAIWEDATAPRRALDEPVCARAARGVVAVGGARLVQ